MRLRAPIGLHRDAQFQPEFLTALSATFAKTGLDERSGQVVLDELAGFLNNEMIAASSQAQADQRAAEAALAAKWGNQNFDKNLAIAKEAARSRGLTPDVAAALETALGGAPALVEFFHKLGTDTGVGSAPPASTPPRPPAPHAVGDARSIETELRTLQESPEFIAALRDPRSQQHQQMMTRRTNLIERLAGAQSAQQAAAAAPAPRVGDPRAARQALEGSEEFRILARSADRRNPRYAQVMEQRQQLINQEAGSRAPDSVPSSDGDYR